MFRMVFIGLSIIFGFFLFISYCFLPLYNRFLNRYIEVEKEKEGIEKDIQKKYLKRKK